MKRLINLLRGYAEVAVEGAFPERLLNLCGQRRVQFWRLRWRDETGFTFRVPLSQLPRLEELAARSGCTLEVRERRGASAVAVTMASRWGFVLGLGLCVLAAGFFSRFLLVVEVTGNETVSTAVILTELQRLGVRPGVYGPAIREREVANQALMDLPQLAYMAINIYGTRAEVAVVEADPAPELLDQQTPADVVAAADGIIEDIQVASGRAQFSDGDIVAKGEVLITGDLDLKEPEGSAVDMGLLVVHAAGTVTARTWRTLEETAPLTTAVKAYTGASRKEYALRLPWGQVDFFQNSSISYGKYDRITTTEYLTLFGQVLPVGVTTTTYREYALSQGEQDREELTARLTAALEARLAQLMDARAGEVLRADVAVREADGWLTVTLLAECREEIGRTVERPGETGRVQRTNETGE